MGAEILKDFSYWKESLYVTFNVKVITFYFTVLTFISLYFETIPLTLERYSVIHFLQGKNFLHLIFENLFSSAKFFFESRVLLAIQISIFVGILNYFFQRKDYFFSCKRKKLKFIQVPPVRLLYFVLSHAYIYVRFYARRVIKPCRT